MTPVNGADKTARKAESKAKPVLLVGTRKGAFLFHGSKSRKEWKIAGPYFLGSSVHHMVLDPRDGRTLLMAAKTGHLGPTVFRSADWGRTWKEAGQPPAFPKVPEGEKGRAVSHTFWLAPGHESQPGAWYAGTSPQGLFRSEDGGANWAPVPGFNEHPKWKEWTGGDEGGTPDGPILHSIQIDPRDPDHLYIGLSGGGVFESRNAGADWSPLNKGVAADFLPVPDPEYGHDPHCVRLHPLQPDRLYQQNHCGIYRLDRPGDVWERIGKNMPKKVGDIGFPMTLHPRDPETAWVFPMDGTDVWPRTSPGGRPAAYRTRNAGKKWERQDGGLPEEHAYFTVRRQAMTSDILDPVGLYFGTTGGELWMSRNEGEKWRLLAGHLPMIFSVEAGMRS